MVVVVVVAAARQEVCGLRHSVRLHGASVRGPSKQDGGAAILSRPLDHASLHARAGGCAGYGMSRGRGREACVRTSGRGVVCRNSSRPEATAELAPTNCGLLASSPVGAMTPMTTTVVGGPARSMGVNMHCLAPVRLSPGCLLCVLLDVEGKITLPRGAGQLGC